ncbi:MAG: Trk system potassium transporter TrkA [bacterium]
MKIVIVGAGQVGYSVAVKMAEKHEVSVVDIDFEVLDELPPELDVYQGEGTNMEVLKEAGVEEAHVVVAGTSGDRTNILVCSTAKILNNNTFTIARVGDASYLQTWRQGHKAFGVDLMLARSYLTGRALVKLIGYRTKRESARDVAFFADRQIQMAEYDVQENSPIANYTVKQADRFEGLTFGAILRDNKMIIPTGKEKIKPGDRVVVIGKPEKVQSFGVKINPSEKIDKLNDVIIFGGSDTGYQTARLLNNKNLNIKIVEKDPRRAHFLAEELPDSLVLREDAFDQSLWAEEQFDRADLHIAALGSDESNLLAGLTGKQKEIAQVISIVHEQKNVEVFENTEIDATIHPREVTVENINRQIRQSYAENIASIVHHKGEVFEINIDEDSGAAGRKIKDIISSLPGQMVVGAIRRNNQVIIPRGNTKLQAHDRLVILAPSDISEDIARQL